MKFPAVTQNPHDRRTDAVYTYTSTLTLTIRFVYVLGAILFILLLYFIYVLNVCTFL